MKRFTTKDVAAAKRFVVIAAAPNIHRQYYDTPFEEGVRKAPVCFSSDSRKPDVKAPQPQSKFCAMCPNNIQGSGNGESRACKFHQKTAVLLHDSLSGPVYQMIISSTSLFKKSNIFEEMGFLQYTKRLLQQGQSINSLVTEVKVVEEGQYERISFKPVLHLDREQLDYVRQRSMSEEVDECLSFTQTTDLLDKKHFFEVMGKMGMEVEV
jgi:hypothetical protein